MTLPKVIAWNCRGVGSQSALRHLLLVRSNNPDILILEEPRVHSKFIARITASTRFNAHIVIEANGFSGGIWILWDDSCVHLELVLLDDQIINVVVWSNNHRA